MSESTDVNDDQSGRRGSRRAMRQAEREAEREAILTGQQPLLTRRELKRQREEAEALRAAVEAGEITAEEARALQDPTAEQPEVKVPDLATTGAHAAVQQADEQEESAGWSAPAGSAEATTGPRPESTSPGEGPWGGDTPWTRSAQTTRSPGSADAPGEREAPDAPGAHAGGAGSGGYGWHGAHAAPAGYGGIEEPVRPGEHGAHAASSISVDASEASASSPSTGASAPGAHAAPPRPGEPEVYDSLPASPLYKESAAIFETSVMAAADLPDHADVAPASVEPATVPQRHSLFGAQRRLSADSGAESVPSSQDPASSGASAPSAASGPAGVSAGPASPSTSPASAAADQARPVDPWAAGSASLSEPDHSAPAHQPAPDAWGAPSEPSWQSLSGGGSGAGSPGAWSAPSTPSWQSVGAPIGGDQAPAGPAAESPGGDQDVSSPSSPVPASETGGAEMPVVPVDSLVPPPTPAPGTPAVPPVAGSSGPVAGHAGAVSPAAAFPPAGGPTVNGPDAGGTASPSMTAVGGGEEARSADTPTRRPIVRIPSAVQGVRTVDSGTGELSAVQPVDEDLSHLETPRWRALHEGASPDQPESVGPVAAEGAGEPGFAAVGARPPTASTPAAAAARREPFGSVRPTPVEPEGRNDKLVRTIMFVLLGVVGVLVVLAVLWFVFLSKGDSSALEAVGPAWSILRL